MTGKKSSRKRKMVDFKVRVCTYLRALGIDVVRKPEDQKRIIAELRKKFRKTLVEVFEGRKKYFRYLLGYTLERVGNT